MSAVLNKITRFQRRLPVGNRALDADYYRHRVEESEARREEVRLQKEHAKAVAAVKHDRYKQIAQDLRTMSDGQAMTKWHVSRTVLEKIRGDIYLGKYLSEEDTQIMRMAEYYLNE